MTMRLPKYFVAAGGTVLAAIAYSRLVRWESDTGLTWYKLAAPIAVLAITNGVQLWALGFGAVTLGTRFKVNLQLWGIVALSLLILLVLSRPGLMRAARLGPGTASIFVLKSCLLLIGTACLNTFIGWFVARVRTRS